MESFKKEDLLRYMWDSHLTPKSENLKEKLEIFLSQQFNLPAKQVSDPKYLKFQKDIVQFITKLRAHAKKKSWQKDRILDTYRVRFDFCNYNT